MDPHPMNVSAVLADVRAGKEAAWERLVALVYGELRSLAVAYFSREPISHTLQPTALVNEAFIKLVAQAEKDWVTRTNFYAAAARVMRQILVDHARRRKTDKRGKDHQRVTLQDDIALSTSDEVDILSLHAALATLSKSYPRQGQVVELRFFGGLTVEQVAVFSGVSPGTIKNDWRFAKAWLRNALSKETTS